MIVDGFKAVFGIESPSKVMRFQIGQMLGKGVAEGIKDSTKDVVDAAKDQMDALSDAYNLPDKFFSVRAGVTYTGIAPELEAMTAGIGGTTITQIINFNEPIESPDTVARSVNRVMTYGLAGAY